MIDVKATMMRHGKRRIKIVIALCIIGYTMFTYFTYHTRSTQGAEYDNKKDTFQFNQDEMHNDNNNIPDILHEEEGEHVANMLKNDGSGHIGHDKDENPQQALGLHVEVDQNGAKELIDVFKPPLKVETEQGAGLPDANTDDKIEQIIEDFRPAPVPKLSDLEIRDRILHKNDIKNDIIKAPPVPRNKAAMQKKYKPNYSAIGINVGEMGEPVILRQTSDKKARDKMFHLHEFNLYLSDRISVNRSLPDIRAKGCEQKDYGKSLLNTSVIIVFYNEARTTLLRTLHSVLNRSPHNLLAEVILVDDGSDRNHLKARLDEYLATHKGKVPVRLVRTGRREGLIRARMAGVAVATGTVFTFLDAHCECTKGWLEPLLSRVTADNSYVPCPVINVIDDETFGLDKTTKAVHVGGFSWDMTFDWHLVPQREKSRIHGSDSEPVRSPTMAGGLFSIHRDFFKHLGMYDPGFEVWGSENLELSFKIWQCGGIIEVVPCSHVGHIFRKKSPYLDSTIFRSVQRNVLRVTEVFLDEYKDLYYAYNPQKRNIDFGNIDERKELRHELGCQSFRWYLENVYPESVYPIDYRFIGRFINMHKMACLDSGALTPKHAIIGNNCDKDKTRPTQLFVLTQQGELMQKTNCLDFSMTDHNVVMLKCHHNSGNQEWEYRNEAMHIVHKVSGKCMALPTTDDKHVIMLTCADEPNMRWETDVKYKGTRQNMNA